ncbi:hypothetical protein QCA50_002434 [Cerrena zonata]|uniref:Uncharacterized protein n=1 Tax=Cerrena zonata TaxID=2478898 RepID=A0AAW0GZB5_9APHY
MSFNPTNDKDQLRLLKGSVQSKLRSAFKPRYRSRSGSALTLATVDSECSTLINFNVDDCLAECEPEEDERPEYLLESDNSAWARGKPKNIPPPGLQKPVRSSDRSKVFQAEMIDEEDRAWNTPRKSMKEARKGFISTITGRHNPPRQVHDRSEMLDAEDRAWM